VFQKKNQKKPKKKKKKPLFDEQKGNPSFFYENYNFMFIFLAILQMMSHE
jgi:hypothetical protein